MCVGVVVGEGMGNFMSFFVFHHLRYHNKTYDILGVKGTVTREVKLFKARTWRTTPHPPPNNINFETLFSSLSRLLPLS